MRRKIYNKIVSKMVRFWFLILIAAAIGVFACYPFTKKLFGNITTDLINLLPDDYPSVKAFEEMRERFKTVGTLIVVLESENPAKTKELLAVIADKLKADPEVKDVVYKKTGFKFFDEHKLLFLELEDLQTIRDRIDRKIQKEKLGSLYIDFGDESENEEFQFKDLETKYKVRYTSGTRSEYITDETEKLYSMQILPAYESDSFAKQDKFYKHIHEILDPIDIKAFDPTMQIHYAGTVRTQTAEYYTLIKDLKVAGLISGIGIFLLLAIYFRHPLAAFIIFIPLSAGIIYSFAFAFIFIKNLNIITSFLFAILGGLGVEVGIHMYARYKEERTGGASIEEALFAMLFYTGRAAITSGITVAVTFLILIINDFKGFSEFGLITGSGIAIVYLTYHVLFPAVLIAFEKMHILRFKKHAAEISHIKAINFPYPKTIFIATMFIVLLSTVGLYKFEFEYRFGNLKADIPEARVAKEKMRKTMSAVNRPAMVMIKSLDDALAIKKVVNERIAEDKEAGRPEIIDTYKSWYDITQYNQDEKMAIIDDIKKLLSDDTLVLVKGENKKHLDRFKEILNSTKRVVPEEIPQEVKDLFFAKNDSEGHQISFINARPDMELDDGRNAIAFTEHAEKFETPRGTFYAACDSIIFANVLKTMLKDSPRVVIFSFISVFLFVFIDFKRFKNAALVVSPIVIGVIIMFGAMYVLKLKLNFFNMIIIPTMFGTSIDNSIHIYHRFEELGRGSLMKVIRTSGGAALMSSMTNIFGFLGLIFANHNGLSSIGKLAIVGMSACLFTTLIYFPAVLQLWFAKKQ